MAKTPREALQTLQKQYARQNEFIKQNYDRLSVTFPKGTKERILATGAASVNGYISRVVLESLENIPNFNDASDAASGSASADGADRIPDGSAPDGAGQIS